MPENDTTLIARAIIALNSKKMDADQVKAIVDEVLQTFRPAWYGTLTEYQALGDYDEQRDYYILADFEVMV